MITLRNVDKRFWTARREPLWVLRDVSLTFPADKNVAIIGAQGSGKSTLLRLLAGIDRPTRGTIEHDVRVSWPVGMAAGMQNNLTGRQNARFICRVEGFDGAELEERLRFVHDFCELGKAFDEPFATYTGSMRGQLNFALSVAFDFDVYLVDQRMSAGAGEFRVKSRNAMKGVLERARIILAASTGRGLQALCQAAVWLHEGKAHWFDSVAEALREHRRSEAA